MRFIVFTQSDEGAIDTAKLARHAERFFSAKVEVVGRKPAGRRDQPAETRIAFRTTRGAIDTAFTLTARKVEKADIRAARDAEVQGQVPGMGALAEDCSYLWEVHVADDVPEKAAYAFCAVLASVALGPVLPPDRHTLLGVRGARQLAEAEAPGYRS